MIFTNLDITEIHHNLWQGSQPTNFIELAKYNFDAIVFCEHTFQPSYEKLEKDFPGILPIYCPFLDDNYNEISPKLHQQFNEVTNQIVGLLKQKKKILIVCFAGLNRSGLISALVLRKYLGMDGKSAIKSVQSRRENSLNNKLFCSYIINFKEA